MIIPQRVTLAEHLPLSAPFSLQIFPTYHCNFKCVYCIQSLSSAEQNDMQFRKQTMPLDVFKKTVDDLRGFVTPLKAMMFAGGEPLMYSAIAEMVGYAKQNSLAERVEIVTNGALLNQSLSDALINAGLDRLRVSLQGVNADAYERVCGVRIDFERFMENLSYFYHKKKSTTVHIKIIDIALSSPIEETVFHSLFDPICDTSAIEYVYPFVEKIDYSTLGGDLTRTRVGDGVARRVDICALPFYTLLLLPNGDVTGCCSIQPPTICGNVMENSVLEMWQGEQRHAFLAEQVQSRNLNTVCKKCTVPDYGMQVGDYLDDYRDRLRELFTINI
jgi:radical SAM protein with 4Fe4S-binding SPASM domain